MEQPLREKLPQLSAYFTRQPEVVMAFIFGSAVKGRATAESDVDIAVYLRPESPTLEWEEHKLYPAEDKLWSAAEKIVGRRVDLVILNRAPAAVVYSVLSEGIELVVKNISLYWRLFLAVSAAAEDFREFSADFRRIKERSKSLSEIDRERLMRSVDFLQNELSAAGKFALMPKKDYLSDDDLRRSAERWSENLVNASIDIAKILLASEKKAIPQTYREVLQNLSSLEEFKPELAEQLAQFAKLRNILAHEYLDIRFDEIHKLAQAADVYRRLAVCVKEKISALK